MILRVDAIDLFLAICEAREGGSEVPPNSNRGPFVEPPLRRVGLAPGNPWCAAEMSECGWRASQVGGFRWPLPLTGGCVVLAEFAEKHGILFDKPQRGDLFVLWERVSGVYRFAHTGAVKAIAPDLLSTTTEGNTNGAGSREGWLHAEKKRYFATKDRFIRWANLL